MFLMSLMQCNAWTAAAYPPGEGHRARHDLGGVQASTQVRIQVCTWRAPGWQRFLDVEPSWRSVRA